MRMPKKILSLVLSATLALQLFPVSPAFALEEDVPEGAIELDVSDEQDLGAAGEVSPEEEAEAVDAAPSDDGGAAKEEPAAGEEPATVEESPAAAEPAGVSEGAPAEQDAANPAEEPAELELTLPGEQGSLADPSDNDELFDAYVQQLFDEQVTGEELQLAPMAWPTGKDAVLYDRLEVMIAEVAAGTRSSTTFEIPWTAFYDKTSFTAADLGLSSLLNGNQISDEALEAIQDLLEPDGSAVVRALLAAHPYELYWFKKSAGWSMGGMDFSYSSANGGTLRVTNANYSISLSVASDYAAGEYQVDGSKIARVNTAVAKAKQIVSASEGLSALERLSYFRQQICALVSYDTAAASYANDTSYKGDPWQLVSVFDGDSSTNVVCEGYSKAFKYLCDLADIPGVDCRLVSGTMKGGTGAGSHMWNVVRMPDGKNYLVDVTNCDTGTIGADDLLFVVPYTSGSVSGGYTIKTKNGSITYTYDSGTTNLFDTSELTLSGTTYDPSVLVKIDLSGAEVTVEAQTYSGSALKPAVTVHLEGRTLTEGTDYTVSYANNTNVGTATVTITGAGGYTGTAKATFDISAASVVAATVTGVSSKAYTGSAITQTPTVKVGSRTLTAGTDYTLTYANNTAVGTATLTITGKGNYTGSKTVTFKITAASLSGATVSGLSAKTYTGKAITQTPTVKVGSRTLTAGTDYTLSAWSNNTNVGTATATITGKGNYTGTKAVSFSITAASVASATVTIASQVYDGTAKTPAPTVKVGSRTLTSGTDYTVTYANNTAVGTATATITGKGNYTGSKAVEFSIASASIASATVTGVSDKTYTGSAITQAPTVKVGTKTLVSGTDYTLSYANNTNVGTATVTITGKGSYGGTKSVTFKIAAASISGATVSAAAQTYDGTAKTPAPTVKVGTKTLVSGTDYTVSYANNTNAGTATVTVTGKGNYTGSKAGSFKITAASLSGATVSGLSAKTYTGSALTQTPTVKVGSTTLKAGTDYTLSAWSNNTNVGTATATITGKGNYTGSKAVTFKITAASLSGATVSGLASKTYTGSAITQTPTVKVGSRTLTAGTDYTLSAWSSNTNVGTATATITGKGNYTGTKAVSFSITRKAVTVQANNASKTFGAADPSLTATVSGTVGSDTVAYTLSRVAGDAVGTYAITASGTAAQGNYQVSFKGATFTINAASISSATVSGLSAKTYTGSALTQTPTVKVGSTTLKAGTDYTLSAWSNNTNVGTATATITGKGNYTGSKAVSFKINAKAISASSVSVASIADQPYTGKAVTPTVTVKDGSTTLVAGTDYTVTYANNTNVGTATVTIAGKGNYGGSRTASFNIVKVQTFSSANAYLCDGSGDPWQGTTYTYTGSAIEPRPFICIDGGLAMLGPISSDLPDPYIVTYKNNVNVGTATITVTGAPGFMQGSITETFVITPADISKATVSAIAAQPYTGKAVTPAVTVKLGSATLRQGTDYTLSYKNNVKAGTATVTVTGKGNYAGARAATFRIVAPSVSYRTHVQTYGWQAYVKDGAMSGTSGKSKRLEGINIRLASKPVSGSIQYRTHVQTYGWEGSWRSDGAMSGTSGQSKRLEAIQIRLTGDMAKRYDVYYRVHCQRIGWMGWAKNGAQAGTAGFSYRLEGIQVVIVPKGQAAPGRTYGGITQNVTYSFKKK